MNVVILIIILKSAVRLCLKRQSHFQSFAFISAVC